MTTAVKFRWIRVSKKDPCSVCHKPDYCDYCPELKLILCMRVASDRPSKNSMGGWLHPMGSDIEHVTPLPPEPPKPKINVTELMRDWRKRTEPDWIRNLAFELGVTYQSLTALGVAWCAEWKSWAFPMFSGWGEPIGIRLRAKDGSKFAYRGSRNGIFLSNLQPQSVAFCCEGPSDSAACISLNLFPIGRPSCNGSLSEVVTACKRLRIQRVVVVSDNDDPGVNGSQALQNLLHIPSVIFVPCAKDLRAAVRFGLTAELVQSTIKNLIWKQPAIS